MRKGKVVASVATVTVFGVFTRIISFVFKIYLSRALGAEAIGLYQIAVSVFYLFASVSAGGIPVVLSRKTAENHALKNDNDFDLVTSALILGLTLSLSISVILAILNNNLSFLFSDPNACPVFLVMIPALISTSVYSVIRAWLWGKKQFSAFSATETAEELLRILFSVLLLSGIISGVTGVYAVAVAFTVSDVIVAIILFVLFFIKGGRLQKPTKIKEILFPSAPVTAMRVFSGLVATLIALILPLRLIAFGMSPSEATASYGRVAGMANPLLFAPNAIIGSLAIVLVPEMSASGAKNDYATLNKHLTSGINFTFLISGLFMVIYLALGREITTILYKDTLSGEYLRYASFLMLPTGLMQLTNSALNSIGKEHRAFIDYLVGNLFLIAAVLVLPKYIGIYSVAVASMLSTLITCVLNAYALRKYTGLGFSFVKYLVYVIVMALPCAFASNCVVSLLGDRPITVIFAAVCGAVSYCGLCFAADLVDIGGFIKLRKGAYGIKKQTA